MVTHPGAAAASFAAPAADAAAPKGAAITAVATTATPTSISSSFHYEFAKKEERAATSAAAAAATVTTTTATRPLITAEAAAVAALRGAMNATGSSAAAVAAGEERRVRPIASMFGCTYTTGSSTPSFQISANHSSSSPWSSSSSQFLLAPPSSPFPAAATSPPSTSASSLCAAPQSPPLPSPTAKTPPPPSISSCPSCSSSFSSSSSSSSATPSSSRPPPPSSSSSPKFSIPATAAGPPCALEAVLQDSAPVPADAVSTQGMNMEEEVTLDLYLRSLLSSGFQATQLGRAILEVERMRQWRLSQEPVTAAERGTEWEKAERRESTRCCIWLSFTSNMMSSGLREVFLFLCKHRFVDVVVTSAGGVEEDFVKVLAPTLVGDFSLQGAELRKKGWNRIGNLLVPNHNYCLFEDWLQPVLDDMLKEQQTRLRDAFTRMQMQRLKEWKVKKKEEETRRNRLRNKRKEEEQRKNKQQQQQPQSQQQEKESQQQQRQSQQQEKEKEKEEKEAGGDCRQWQFSNASSSRNGHSAAEEKEKEAVFEEESGSATTASKKEAPLFSQEAKIEDKNENRGKPEEEKEEGEVALFWGENPASSKAAEEDFLTAVSSAVWSPSEVIRRLGEEIDDERSVFYWCAKNNIPVFCPGLTDGSLGDNLFFHSYRKKGLVIDIVKDIRAVNDISLQCKKSGMIILGGGLPKHHTCNANLMRNGADFAVYINTGAEYDGSDSGARPDEAVSWGKITTEAKPVKVHGDATLLFPLVVAATFAKEFHEKKRKQREEMERQKEM